MRTTKYNLSHYIDLTCDLGQLIPIMAEEVLPGDIWKHHTTAFLRVTPLLAPVMHPVEMRIHHFYVPNRIIWDDWEDFITGGPDGDDTTTHPTIDLLGASTAAQGSLADYLGIPTGSDITVNALPFRAYAKIVNEYYRDQDIVTEIGLSEASGDDSTTNTSIQNCAWAKDYLTAARPWTQKGSEVTIPLGTRAPVRGIG